MRCASYTRTISCLRESEVPKDIISQQNKRIQEFVKSRGWTLVEKYSDRKKDEFEEKAFLEMKQGAMARKFDCLVMDSIFRCGRNTNVAAEIFRNVFLPAGIEFAVAEDDFCSCDVGMEASLAYLQEKVKEYRSYTVNEDMRKYVETKKYPKYGYQYKEADMELEVDPVAAANVERIFQLVREGHSFKETAEIMTKDGIMSSGKYIDGLWGRTIVNLQEPWKKDQIKRIIYNRLYIGEWVRTVNGEKRTFSCPAIIDKELFEEVNNRRDLSKCRSNCGKTPLNPFSKLIFDKGTGIPLKIFTHERLGIRVFRRSYGSKEKMKYKRGNIPYGEVSDGVHKFLLREKEAARKIGEILESSEWEREKERQIQKVRALAQIIFHRMMELESNNVKLYQKFNARIISQEEYEKEKEKNICEIERNDGELQQYMEQIKEIEICFSNANPWLCLFREIDVPVELKREDVKKWIERIDVVKNEYVEVRFKNWEWKERFPKQWLEV